MQVGSYIFQSPYPQSVQVGRPDPVEEQKKAAQEESAKSKESLTDKQTIQPPSDASQISVQSSTMYQNDISSKSTSEAVNTLIATAKEANRSDKIGAYTSIEQN
jgi:hypothetical protein